ncbi:MAG TPA: DNA-processing protein DprA, partial [Armatimonadota bacterium]|nr:DNA-processing protein DprA [Armatimonadota bacterium]
DQDRAAWAALYWEGALGPAGFARLIARFGSARVALSASEDDLSTPSLHLRRGQPQLIRLSAARHVEDVARQIEELETAGIAVICSFEAHYPAMLRTASNPPPVICMRGNVAAEDDPALAIVGTRSPTPEGEANARDIARACAERGVTIVSGLALGVDTAAHRGALEAGARTIAILGSGIRHVHPTRNRRLAERIVACGALISESPPDANPSAARLMARNRLIAAMARGVLAVESLADGGTLQTVRDGVSLSRLLFACDWQADKPQADGTRTALGMGGEPVLGPDAADFVVQAIRDHRLRGPDQPSLL